MQNKKAAAQDSPSFGSLPGLAKLDSLICWTCVKSKNDPTSLLSGRSSDPKQTLHPQKPHSFKAWMGEGKMPDIHGNLAAQGGCSRDKYQEHHCLCGSCGTIPVSSASPCSYREVSSLGAHRKPTPTVFSGLSQGTWWA